MMLLVLLAVILFNSVFVQHALGSDQPKDAITNLKRLCGYYYVDITRISDLESLAGELDEVDDCPDDLVLMLAELSNKIGTEIRDNACSVEMAQFMRDYYTRYIYISGQSWLSQGLRMPHSFRRLVLAIGMQMSNVCKKQMVKELTNKNNNLLREEDLKRLGRWIDEEGPLAHLLSNLNAPGDMIMPADLAALLHADNSTPIGKLHIQSEATKSIKRLKEVCQKRFQPVYEKLVLPVTILNGVGFNYRDKELKAELEKPETIAVIKQWTNIVFLCETMKLVEPVEYLENDGEQEQTKEQDTGDELDLENDQEPDGHTEPEQSTTVANNDVSTRTIRLLTKEEADAINEQLKSRVSLRHLLHEESPDQLEKFEFTPTSKVGLEDLVLVKSDRRLRRALRGFNARKTHMQRVKAKVMHRNLVQLLKMVWRGKFILMTTVAFKATWARLTNLRVSSGEDDPNKMFVKTIESMIDKTVDVENKWERKHYVMFAAVLVLALGLLTVPIWAVVAAAITGTSLVAGLGSG